MKRMRTGRNDKNIFRRTAAKVKSVNLPSTVYRGGIRF